MRAPKVELLSCVGSHMQLYITLHGIDGSRTYSYAARGFVDLPVILKTVHERRCGKGESWLYVAVTRGADPARLSSRDKLYVGSQTQDRMFRGDGMGGDNYHHAEMRAGSRFVAGDTLEAHLRGGGSVEIYRIRGSELDTLVRTTPALRDLDRLAAAPLSSKTHRAWWYENYILTIEPPPIWRWNSQGGDKRLAALW